MRRDLRLDDHPALQQLLDDGYSPIPVYLHAPDEQAPWAPGAANRWWLHHSLCSLRADLQALGSDLLIRSGPSFDGLDKLLAETGAEAVYWHRLYEPAIVERDIEIKARLRAQGVAAHSCSGHLLSEPDRVLNLSGGPYRVFTPYWKALSARFDQLGAALDPPAQLPAIPNLSSLAIDELELLPNIPWDKGFYAHWNPGEQGAHRLVRAFAADSLAAYAQERDRPDQPGTSALSAHLHFGEVSVRRMVSLLATEPASEPYLRQLGWRDYSHYLLRHFPQTTEQPLNARFKEFDWVEPDPVKLAAWQQGRTGIPMVDAGMRQLWKSGWMHNRVRMLVASFLCKNLRYHWLNGARWFWDTLIDADLANNSQGWQWTAGTGVDAAPYFRIFNPVTQGKRFDPDGSYVRRWVPELAGLSGAAIHEPWKLGRVGKYPQPIVDLKQTRESALDAFKALKNNA